MVGWLVIAEEHLEAKAAALTSGTDEEGTCEERERDRRTGRGREDRPKPFGVPLHQRGQERRRDLRVLAGLEMLPIVIALDLWS